jgi:hypothetical protein
MFNKNLSILFTLVFFFGCTTETQDTTRTATGMLVFQEEIVLQPMVTDDTWQTLLEEVFYPQFISVIDSTLLVLDRSRNTDFFRFYSLENGSYLGSFGKRGEGPEEYSGMIQHVVQTINPVSEAEFTVFDWVKKRLTAVNINFSSQENENSPSSSSLFTNSSNYLLLPDLMFAQRAAFLNDSTLIGMGGTEKGMLFFVDVNTDSTWYIPFQPQLINGLQRRDILEMYRGEFAIHRQHGRIAIATKWFPEIVISDLDGNPEKVIQLMADTHHPSHFDEENRVLYYKDIKATDNYIYAVYLGLSFKQMEELLDEPRTSLEDYSTEIHVFDWQGNPVRKFILENHFVQFIAIDPKSNKILALDILSDESALLSFGSQLIK